MTKILLLIILTSCAKELPIQEPQITNNELLEYLEERFNQLEK